jgi:hypothetical protein
MAVGVATRASDTVTADTELLASPPVTRRARPGVDPCLHAVLSAAARRAHPTGRVRAPRRRSRCDARCAMAIAARALAMTGGAQPRRRPRLLGVARAKASEVQARESSLVQSHSPGESGNRRAMARRARPLGVTRSAEIARARRARAVLAQPITVVHDVAGGQRALLGQVHVATITIAHRPLVFVLMTSKAGRHLRAQRLRPGHAYLAMTTDAIAARRRHVRSMIEPQVPARHLRAGPHERFAVTIPTGTSVMRLLVTPNAVRSRGEMELALVLGAHDAGVAHETVDSLKHVRAVLERVRRSALVAENARARSQRQGQHEHRCRATRHGRSSARLTRKSALASKE